MRDDAARNVGLSKGEEKTLLDDFFCRMLAADAPVT